MWGVLKSEYIKPIVGRSLTLSQANGSYGWMGEHDGGDGRIIHLGVSFVIKQSVSQLPAGSDGHWPYKWDHIRSSPTTKPNHTTIFRAVNAQYIWKWPTKTRTEPVSIPKEPTTNKLPFSWVMPGAYRVWAGLCHRRLLRHRRQDGWCFGSHPPKYGPSHPCQYPVNCHM